MKVLTLIFLAKLVILHLHSVHCCSINVDFQNEKPSAFVLYQSSELSSIKIVSMMCFIFLQTSKNRGKGPSISLIRVLTAFTYLQPLKQARYFRLFPPQCFGLRRNQQRNATWRQEKTSFVKLIQNHFFRCFPCLLLCHWRCEHAACYLKFELLHCENIMKILGLH